MGICRSQNGAAETFVSNRRNKDNLIAKRNLAFFQLAQPHCKPHERPLASICRWHLFHPTSLFPPNQECWIANRIPSTLVPDRNDDVTEKNSFETLAWMEGSPEAPRRRRVHSFEVAHHGTKTRKNEHQAQVGETYLEVFVRRSMSFVHTCKTTVKPLSHDKHIPCGLGPSTGRWPSIPTTGR